MVELSDRFLPVYQLVTGPPTYLSSIPGISIWGVISLGSTDVLKSVDIICANTQIVHNCSNRIYIMIPSCDDLRINNI